MKFSLKSILATLAIAVSMTACNFGDTNETTTNRVTYESTDLLMRLDAAGNVTTPEPPKIQVDFKTSGGKATISIGFTNLRLVSGTETFTIPEMPVTFNENGMEVRQLFITPIGSSVTIDNFVLQINGNWLTISMTANNENVTLCSAWVWTGQQLYAANYDYNDMKGNVVLMGGDSYVVNPVDGTNFENKNIEYGFVFDTKNKVVNVYSFFTSLTDASSATKTYLFEKIPYTMEAGGISIQSAADQNIVGKIVTKYEKDGKEDPEMTISNLSAYIPYSGLSGDIRYVATANNINVSCNPLKMLNQIAIH